MGFRTKLDYSDNRQIKQHVGTLTHLSGATTFGIPYNQLPIGPDSNTSAITKTLIDVGSTFYTNNNGITVFDWYDNGMQLGYSYITGLTPSNSAITQNIPAVFTAATTNIVDGRIVALSYTGVSYDLTAIAMYDLGNGNYSGTTVSNQLNFLSAGTLDYTGRTIWVDVSGTTRTQSLIVTDGAQTGYVLTSLDNQGTIGFAPSGGGGSTGTTSKDVFVTGGTYNSVTGMAIFRNNTGGTFSVVGFNAAAGVTYWSAGTGNNAIVTIDSGNDAQGDNSLAEGSGTTAIGAYSHAEGFNTIASGTSTGIVPVIIGGSGSYATHAEGDTTLAVGVGAHSEGYHTTAFGYYGSHAEGQLTIASGNSSHAEGNGTQAIGQNSHAEGYGTTALGDNSHAEGEQTQALGFDSHAEGYGCIAHDRVCHAEGNQTQAFSGSHSEGDGTLALGVNCHAEGQNTIANFTASHAEGQGSIASGQTSHAQGQFTIASGDYSHAGGSYSKASGIYSFVHGQNSIASGNTTIVLGSNLTGTSNNTVHVQNLNINTGGTFTFGITKLDEHTLAITSASLSTGLYLFTNQGITYTTPTTFNLGAVKGWIVDSRDVLNANPVFINFAGASGLTTPYMSTSPASYLMINSGNTVTILNTRPTTTQRRDNIYLGALGHTSGVIDSYGNSPDIMMNEMSQVRAMFEPIRLINDGVIAYPNANDLTMANTSGTLYGLGIGFIKNGNLSPTAISVPAGAPTTFQYRTQTSGAFSDTTLIDPQNWDNNGTTNGIGGNPNTTNATNQRIYLLEDGGIRIQYGQVVYANLAAAISAINTEKFVLYPNNRNLGILIGILSVRKNTTNLSDTTYAQFFTVSKFGESVGASAGATTSTLQSAYNNSGDPEIVTNTNNLAVTIKRGTAADTDNVFEIQNGAGTITLSIDGNGLTKVNSLNIAAIGAGLGTIDIGVNALGLVVNQASDEKLKENVVTIENALEKVKKLRGVSYQWKDKLRGGNEPRLGFIAQEVLLVEPRLVTQIGDGLLGVNYRDATALLAEAIKELSSKIPLTDKIIKDDELIIPKYTPLSSADINGFVGSLSRDEDYLYMKTDTGWKRTKFENF